MITASNFLTQGRLGNILFRMCSLIGIAKKYNTELKLPKWDYAKYFDYDYPEGEITGNVVEVREPTYHYNPHFDLIKEHDNVDLLGYFQTEEYWKDSRSEVKKALTFKPEFKKQVLDKFVSGCKVNPFEKRPIAISVRRGDYVNNPDYAQLPISYYILALFERFPDFRERSIIVFSDDTAYCRVHFECLPNVHFSENNSDIEDLCLMSQCSSFILSNSTFSWWGAYLAELQNPVRVIRPNHHFAGDLLRNNKECDIYPKRWEVFDHKNEWGHNKRIDLRDTCFTIPVAYDHPDRKENLLLCIKMIRKYFDTKIFVTEQGKEPLFGNLDVDKQHFDTYGGKFHRTKMLNEMALATDCKYIFNWDADVIIAPLQILETVNQLRAGADMVYPYRWAFARIPRKPLFQKLWNFEDIGILGDTKFSGMNSGDAVSVGGAVGFNRESFIKGGMENENFVSYGPEDVERRIRFQRLGFRIERSLGATMYHVNHWVGPNSSFDNPDYATNRQELERIESLTKEQLQEDVSKWSWVPKS